MATMAGWPVDGSGWGKWRSAKGQPKIISEWAYEVPEAPEKVAMVLDGAWAPKKYMVEIR
ncbi:hypothetical protein ACQ4XT_18960 [Halobacillus faecis]